MSNNTALWKDLLRPPLTPQSIAQDTQYGTVIEELLWGLMGYDKPRLRVPGKRNQGAPYNACLPIRLVLRSKKQRKDIEGAFRACSLKQGDAEQGLEKSGQATAALEPDHSSG